MKCPFCGVTGSGVVETRAEAKTIRRRRQCACGARWTTREAIVKDTVDTTGVAQQTLLLGSRNARDGVSETLAVSGSDPGSSPVSGSGSSLSSPEIQKNYNTMGAAAAPNLHARALALFSRTWEQKYGVPYSATPADRSQLGLFLRHTDRALLADLPRAFARYLEDTRPFVMLEQRHSLKFFLTSGGFNHYRTPEVLVTTQREADNKLALDQWQALRNGHGR